MGSISQLFTTIIFIILNVHPYIYADTNIDSLKNDLRKPKISKEHTLTELCWAYKYSKPDSAKLYGNQAVKIAIKIIIN